MNFLFAFLLTSSLSYAKETIVYAASSLTDVLPIIAKEYGKTHSTKIKFNFDSSSRLARQIEQGAPADLFFSAEKSWVDHLKKKNKVREAFDLLSNDLVVIAPKSKSYQMSALEDLPKLPFKRLSMAHENVPAGKYGMEALMNSNVYDRVKGKILSGDSVRQALSWVARDEADLGIVFASDAKFMPEVKVLYVIPAEFHSKVIYPVTLLNTDNEANDFYRFLRTPRALELFKVAGLKVLAE